MQKVSLPIAIIMAVFLIANTAIIVSKKEFKIIRKRYTSMVVYFFYISIITVVSFINWLLARKFPIFSELVILVYGLSITLFLLPIWY